MTDVKELILNILMRTKDVREWPADEQHLHRTWKGDFTSRAAGLAELRMQKILDALQVEEAPLSSTLSTRHDFTDSESCTFCGANQWEISTGENDCLPHALIRFAIETPSEAEVHAPDELNRDSLARLAISPTMTDAQWDRFVTADSWSSVGRLKAAYASADAILAAMHPVQASPPATTPATPGRSGKAHSHDR